MSTGALAPARGRGSGGNHGPGGLAGFRPPRYIRSTTPLDFRVLGPLQVASNGTVLAARGDEAAGSPCAAPAARERGGVSRSPDRRALGRVAARFGGEHRPGLRLALAQDARARARAGQARAARLAPAGLHAEDPARSVRRRPLRPAVRQRAGGFWKREMPTPRPNACGLLSTSGVGPRSPTSRTSRSRAWRRNASRSSGSSCSRTGSTPISCSAVTVCSSASYASSSRSTRSASGCGRS